MKGTERTEDRNHQSTDRGPREDRQGDRQDRGPKSLIYGPRTIDQRSTDQQIYTLRARSKSGPLEGFPRFGGESKNGAKIV